MNILMVGSRYLPYRHEGDKNFWITLIETLRQEVESVFIISINRDHRGVYYQAPNIQIRNVSPFLFPAMWSRLSDPNLRLSNSYISRSVSFLKIHGEIARVLREGGIQLVHFMDNYGPLMLRLQETEALLSIFAPTYHPRHPLYNYFLKLSLIPFDRIITTTYAFKRKLISLEIPPEKIEVIRWGVNTSELKPSSTMKEQTKQKLGLRADSKLILWSGFIQQTGVREFQFSLKVAEEVLKRAKNLTFIFALKHVHFREEYLNHEREGIRIVSTKSNTDYLRLVNASDGLLSPILAKDSTVAPPLTWMESMALGVPVITTNIGGVDELVSDGHTGYTFNTIQEAVQKIQRMLENERLHRKISQESRKTVSNEYDIRNIADRYKHLWKRMCE